MAAKHLSGTGDPNGAAFGDPGDIYQDETGSFWLKETGAGTNTGWVQLSSSSSVVPASNVLTFRPGSGETGPVVFDDFNALYAQFDALRAAAQSSGKFKIVFDDQSVGLGNPVVLDSGPGGTTYDLLYAELVGVHEDANVNVQVTDGGGEGDSLTIVNALWFEGLTITATGTNTPFVASNNQTFTLTRTTFLGGGGQFVMDFLGVTGCILHLNDESTIERNGVFPAGQAAIRINTSLVVVHMNGANCRINANAFVTGGGGQLTPIVNSASARFDFDQADVGGVVNAQMSTATGYWTYGAPFTVTDPNGVLSASQSTLIIDEATGIIWRNTDGATAWVQFGVTQYAFVYQPGGTPHDNVFDDWASLVTAMDAVDGPKLLEFDDTFAACVVPAGTWDVTDVVWQGFGGISDGFSDTTFVLLDTGASLVGLREVQRIRLEAAAGGPPPISDMVSGDLFVLDDHASLQGDNTIISCPNVEFAKTVYIDLRNGSQVIQGGGGVGIISLSAPDQIFLMISVDKTSVFEANTLDNNGGSTSHTVSIELAGSPEDHPAIQSFFVGNLAIVYNASGYDFAFDQEPLQLDPCKVYLYTNGTAVVVNLQLASWNPGGWVIVKNATASLAAITITPSGADTIDGTPTYVIAAAFGAVTLFSDGISTWHVIGKV